MPPLAPVINAFFMIAWINFKPGQIYWTLFNKTKITNHHFKTWH